ncbi:S-adenosyl-L-methionine-dependent methyltransferase [Laetiporus sulphureus 93-53]|uniref:S-adenosyl-L-methionine-dependent methyltransferase n=1 Tax=Laetiporus sulphureus 93-53 TaxID=1314785 RepID=A0A165FGE8_9APHY|nr:S-adenosyl-L-methionine-dependent methyltransferase [Laetiporus sulphureus 93-53]KZT08932.1 S-adenosyl-L-methionine-dependent methyltransferase [Laetiporus sulphureus 93-53]
MTTRALEFYSGIGGLHRALSKSDIDGIIVRAFDWDQCACRVYAANYGGKIVRQVDISTLSATELTSYGADLWMMSPSCQPYTVLNPLAKDAADPRAKSFIRLMENVLPEMAKTRSQPKYLLIENVAGFESSSTRQRLLATLDSLDYSVLELLLTPLQFGIPNSRLRYYLLAKLNPASFANVHGPNTSEIWRHIPGHGQDWIDPRFTSDQPKTDSTGVKEIRQYLDPHSTEGDIHPNAVPDHVLAKWGRLFDIILPFSRRSCCFTRGYAKMAERSGSVLQMNEELDTTSVFNRFLVAQGRGEKDAVRMLDPLRLRYFSPSELLRIFCFEPSTDEQAKQTFSWPNNLSMKTKNRLIDLDVHSRSYVPYTLSLITNELTKLQ